MQSALLGLTIPLAATTTRPLPPPCTHRRARVQPVQRRRRALAPASRRSAVIAAAAGAADAEVVDLKMALLDSFWGTERGLAASSDSRAEINELITQLEARNPTPEPNEAAAALGGTWRLSYTSNSELMALLALARLPLVSVGDITQIIDPLAQTVENRVELQGPGSKTALSATASFEVRSPKLLQISFEEGRVATPTLLADLQLPSTLDLMGQQVDLSPLQAVLQPVEGPLRSAVDSLSGLLRQVPDLRIPVNNVQASSWLLTTYLDDSLRITRGDGGSVFVLVRDAYSSDPFAAPASETASGMQSGDWLALEEREPQAAVVGGVADVPTATVVATAGDGPSVIVVEPSAVLEEQDGSSPNLNGSNGSLP
ncbi:hypothetical protein D9Q98_002013 [Chlorella vulgaris]|uniref:Plastid lipid-associated protein/fibrillin conserved domain-containing protein n=1 Tax=Chlorella vulgaris TaxID=3077 RepID=A0A9D4TVE6_CHLVU|nr:hypothetical protein D9Q98_002013 [Chlorella vulgaris]